MLCHQPLVDAAGSVTLLARTGCVFSQPPIDDGNQGTQDGPDVRLAQSVARRAGIPNRLPHRTPVVMPLPSNLVNALAIDKVRPSYLF